MERTIDFGEHRLAYTQVGQGRHRLLFIHGLCGQQEVWAKQVSFFASNFEVVTVDLLGHGRSSSISGTDLLVASAQGLLALVKRDPVPTTVIGHSLGGMLVDDLIGKHPSLESYVFVDSPCLWKAEDLNGYRGYHQKILVDKTPKEFFRRWFGAFVTSRMSAAEAELILKGAIDRDPQWMAELMASVPGPHGPCESNPKVFVMEGNQYFSPGNSISWTQYFPKASKWTYSGSGHYYFLDDPTPFNEALSSFLN